MLCGMARIAIVGGGSMGEALLSGLLRAGRQVKDLVVAERMPDRARYLAETYSVLVTSLPDAVGNATFVIIAVKPSDVGSVVAEIAKVTAQAADDSPDQVFITVAAGVTTAYLESKLLAGTPVVRVMPNAPALVGAGISAMAKGRFATPEQLKEVAAVFDSVGAVLTVPEEHLDAVTAVSGSGPAYFFLMVEALVDAGVGVGLSRSVSTELVAQTMVGGVVAGPHGARPRNRRRGNAGPVFGHHRGATARDCYLARRYYRGCAAGTGRARFAGGRGRGGAGRKNPL